MKKTFLIFLTAAITLFSCQNTEQQKESVAANSDEQPKEENTITHTPMDLNSFEIIKLLSPELTGGKSLMEAMHLRQSSREFKQQNLSLNHLSDILWVANGVNRKDIGKKTVPSAMAMYPIKTYAVLENGIYFYNPSEHQLEPVVSGDYRNLAGLQDFVTTAPLNVIFIADYNVYDGERKVPEDKRLYLAALDAAHCCQNIYLYCASEGLKTVERAGAKENELLEVLNLDSNHKFIVAQTIGY